MRDHALHCRGGLGSPSPSASLPARGLAAAASRRGPTSAAPAVALLRFVTRIFYQNELLAEVDMDRVRASVAESQSAIYDNGEAGSRLRLCAFDAARHTDAMEQLGARAAANASRHLSE
mgnify:CR=1 FL=1